MKHLLLHVWRALWLSAALLVMALPARAQDGSAAFESGREKFKAGDFAAALPLFEEALAASKSPNARMFVARCLRDLGRLDEAYEEMRRTVEDARKLAETEERYAATRDAAAGELALLEPRVAKLIVALDASLGGATVTLNGSPLPPERIGVPIAVLPGNVAVVAQTGSVRVAESASVAAGDIKTFTLIAPRQNAAAAAPVPETSDAQPDEVDDGSSFGIVRGIGIGVAALGVGGIVLFAVGSSIADEKLAELETQCGGPCPDDSLQGTVDDGKRAETMAGVGLGIGIAGLVGGALMIVFGGGDAPSETGIAPAPGGLRVRF